MQMIVSGHHGFVDRVCLERRDCSRISHEGAIAFTAECDGDSGVFVGLACHVSYRYSQLLQCPQTEIPEVILSHMTEERNAVSKFCHAGSKDRRGTSER